MRAPVYEGNRWAPEYVAYLPGEIATWRRVIRENRIQAINPYFPALYQFTVALLRATGFFKGKFIPTFQGSDVRIAITTARIEGALLSWMLHQADAIVACSRGLGDELLAFDSSLAPKMTPILNGVSVEDFLARRDNGFDPAAVIPEGRRLILNVAGYEYRKGHDLLLSAFAGLSKEWDNLHLAIVGAKGPELEKTRAQVAELGLNGRVSLLVNEPYNRIPAYMARSDVFVLTSRWIKGKMGEGLPLALLEAGAAGVPVVSTRSTGVEEIVTDGVNGRVVPVEDIPALASAIRDVLSRPVEAKRWAEELRKRAAEFSWRSRWQLYREICEA